MKPFKVARFQTIEPKALKLTARELGHGLRTRSHAELAAIRSDLSAIVPEAENDYARGFLDAIEQLLAGLSAEVKHRAAIARDVATTKVRKNAAKVLVALNAGETLPTDIATRAGLTTPAVSAELSELEREQLVERLQPSPGEDQRTAPRALTIRGAQLARALSKDAVSPTAHAARELAPVFITFMNTLSDQSFLAPQRLLEIAVESLGKASGAFVCEEFLRHADRQRVISISNSALTLTSEYYARRLHDALQSAVSSAQTHLVLEQVKRLTPSAEVCLRATTSMRAQWQLAFSKYGMRNVHAWCLDDARTEQLLTPRGQYHIVWENPVVLSRDLEDSNLRSFVTNAVKRHCYAVPGMELPVGIERLDLEAHYVDG